MSLTIFISDRAEEDLKNQYRWYFENASRTIAERFLAAFDNTLPRLAHSPQLGRIRRFRSRELAGIRSIALARPFELHLVFYKVTPTRLSIERIMHSSRDLPRRLVENL